MDATTNAVVDAGATWLMVSTPSSPPRTPMSRNCHLARPTRGQVCQHQPYRHAQPCHVRALAEGCRNPRRQVLRHPWYCGRRHQHCRGRQRHTAGRVDPRLAAMDANVTKLPPNTSNPKSVVLAPALLPWNSTPCGCCPAQSA